VLEDARLRIVQEGEAGRIQACGLTVEGWPVSPLPAGWRGAIDRDADLSCEVTNVELRLDDLIAADLLPAVAERGRWPAPMALAYMTEGVPLEWKEWLHWRADRGLSEMGPSIEQAGIDLASAIGADQVLAWGRLTPQGPMEQIPSSDLRIPGFVWVVRPDGDLGTNPPGKLAVFRGRPWYGIEVDPDGVKRAFLKPLPGGRWMLYEAEQFYTEGGSEPAVRAEESTPPKPAPPVEPPSEPKQPAPAKKRTRPRGPKPGTVKRYDSADRKLFNEVDRLMSEERLSRTAATLRLAENRQVAGTGTATATSRARRLAKLHKKERSRARRPAKPFKKERSRARRPAKLHKKERSRARRPAKLHKKERSRARRPAKPFKKER
jgi:hypothetical protein